MPFDFSTYQFITNLNPHLALKILDYEIKRNNYDERYLNQLKFDIITKSTRMADPAKELCKVLDLSDESEKNLQLFEKNIKMEIFNVNKRAEKAIEFFTDETVQSVIFDEKLNYSEKFSTLSKKENFSSDLISQLHEFAIFSFSIGYDYNAVNIYLTILFNCVQEDNPLFESILWGKIISSVLVENFDDALSSVTEMTLFLLNHSQNNSFKSETGLKQLLHTSLMIYFNNQNFIEIMLSTYLKEQKLLFFIVSNAPHLLKYIIAASLIEFKSFWKIKSSIEDLVVQIKDVYTDPFIQFFDNLFLKYDSDLAIISLKSCLNDSKNDFILGGYFELLKTNFLAIYSLISCKIYKSINTQSILDETQIECTNLNKTINEFIDEKKTFGSFENNILTLNLTDGRKENLIEKSIDLFEKSSKLLEFR